MLTPKMDPAYIRHCAKNSSTESDISPVGGTMNPAVARATPAKEHGDGRINLNVRSSFFGHIAMNIISEAKVRYVFLS